MILGLFGALSSPSHDVAGWMGGRGVCSCGEIGSLCAWEDDIDGSAQDCRNSIALTMELLQSCAKPSIYFGISNNPNEI